MNVPRGLIAAVVFGLLFWMVWSKLRIVILIPLSGWQAFLIFVVVATALFLAIDHWLNSSKK